MRQTPANSGTWRNVDFKVDESGDCDYVLIHGHAAGLHWVKCPPQHIWLVLGEPPNESYETWQEAPTWISKVFTTDDTTLSHAHKLSHPGSPWHVNKDYDYLKACLPMTKTENLSWITSNRIDTIGHRFRMSYASRVTPFEELKMFGRGFQPIEDKWDGLADYRYSIAFENFRNDYYFTEKIMDCFLSWTMPIYYGCSKIKDFFPPNSIVCINPESEDPIADLKKIIESDFRERNIDAIAEARRLVLDHYNLFEFMVRNIEASKTEITNIQAKKVWIRDHTSTPLNVVKDLARRAIRGAE